MGFRKYWSIAVYIILISVGVGTSVYFKIRGTVEVFEGNITVSPQSFSVDIAKGTEYVKSITVRNYGKEVSVYFEDVVEGPNPEGIDVSYKDVHGNSIYSSKKLLLPGGTKEKPSNTTVHVHLEVKGSAEIGKYNVYIFVRS
ncbi:MAG: hypothetical protein RMH75_06855 [Archaeoglobaceae archaeon]|nr:hypothetical protein [Archaeoglobaceae archaeon]MDW7990361.1 hypothetical protein [Archaeoglobaceae archaeon]